MSDAPAIALTDRQAQDARAAAVRMIARYGTSSQAADAATDHAFGHDHGTVGRVYWLQVRAYIISERTHATR